MLRFSSADTGRPRLTGVFSSPLVNMAASPLPGERLTAAIVAECRTHFRSGLDVFAVTEISGLDTETVQRIHDVHTGSVGRQRTRETNSGSEPWCGGRAMGRGVSHHRVVVGKQAEHQARVQVAMRLVGQGFGIGLAAAVSGADVKEVALAWAERDRPAAGHHIASDAV